MNKVYLLNPDYVIRKDSHRYLLYNKLSCRYNSSTVLSLIHPIHAKVFSFFTERRTLSENITLIANCLSLSEEDTQRLILPFLENENPVFLRYKTKKIKIPAHLLLEEKHIEGDYLPEKYQVSEEDCKSEVDLVTKRLEIPRIITFMLTNTCCTKCCYCYADTTTKVTTPLPTERILKLVRQAKEVGIYNINLIGGEVFLHQHWDAILKEIIANGFSPDPLSTKVPITESIISRLKDTGYSKTLQLSIDTFLPELASQTLRVNANYVGEIKKGIDLLENSPYYYRIETVLTKSTATIENIQNLYNYFSTKKHIKQWEVRVAMFSNNKDAENFISIKSNRATLDAVYDYVEKQLAPQAAFAILSPRKELDTKYFSADAGSTSFKGSKCSALNEHFFILPDGKATICEQLYWNPRFIIGDVSKSDLLDVWHSERTMQLVNLKQKDLQKKSACSECKLFEDCFKKERNRCWSDIIKAYGTDCWDYPDPRCVYAPKMQNDITYK
ncbi:radical SAM protein [Bacteroides fluxus]|jgi:radical SAM protein with 4Fe4S-binding SPASM domain